MVLTLNARGIEEFLSDAAGVPAWLIEAKRMGGGALQENWALDVQMDAGPLKGRHALVLRTSPPRVMADSVPRAQEFAVLKAAFEAGVTVPEPLWLCRNESVIGRAFFVMRRVAGVALGQKVVRDPRFVALRAELAERLARELARIHAIRPGHPGLADFPMPKGDPARFLIGSYRAVLDGAREAHPALEWGLAWLEERAGPTPEVVLCHRDFRTGNYLVDPDRPEAGGLSGILDWEFSGWGDPMEDLGFFCSRSWRFGADDRPAGGLTTREVFSAAYARASGRRVDPERLSYWEVMGNVRWAVIAIQQAERHLSGIEPSLELAAIGRRTAEMELEVLALTGAL